MKFFFVSVTIMFVLSFVLTSLFSLFYVTRVGPSRSQRVFPQEKAFIKVVQFLFWLTMFRVFPDCSPEYRKKVRQNCKENSKQDVRRIKRNGWFLVVNRLLYLHVYPYDYHENTRKTNPSPTCMKRKSAPTNLILKDVILTASVKRENN